MREAFLDSARQDLIDLRRYLVKYKPWNRMDSGNI